MTHQPREALSCPFKRREGSDTSPMIALRLGTGGFFPLTCSQQCSSDGSGGLGGPVEGSPSPQTSKNKKKPGTSSFCHKTESALAGLPSPLEEACLVVTCSVVSSMLLFWQLLKMVLFYVPFGLILHYSNPVVSKLEIAVPQKSVPDASSFCLSGWDDWEDPDYNPRGLCSKLLPGFATQHTSSRSASPQNLLGAVVKVFAITPAEQQKPFTQGKERVVAGFGPWARV